MTFLHNFHFSSHFRSSKVSQKLIKNLIRQKFFPRNFLRRASADDIKVVSGMAVLATIYLPAYVGFLNVDVACL